MSGTCPPLEFSDLWFASTSSLSLPFSFCSRSPYQGGLPCPHCAGQQHCPQPCSTCHPALAVLCILCCMSNRLAYYMFSWLFSVSPHENVSSTRAGTLYCSATSPEAKTVPSIWWVPTQHIFTERMKVRMERGMLLSSCYPTMS